MSGFCAVYFYDEQWHDDTILENMLSSLSLRGDRVGTWAYQGLLFAMAEWKRYAPGTVPYCSLTRNVVIAADLRLDYRSDLIAKLQTAGIAMRGESDIELLAGAYEMWGRACVSHLEGDYAFILWDGKQQKLFGARSITGLRSFLFYRDSRCFLCASEAKQLLLAGIAHKHFHPGWMATWLTEGHASWDSTAYECIEKLPPGFCIIVDESTIRIEPFWHPTSPSHLEFRSQQDYTEQFRSHVFAAVHSHLFPSVPCLIDISGGLDSSSLACIAGKFRQQSTTSISPLHGIHAYSSSSKENDDRHLAKLVAETTAIPISYLSYDDFEPFRGVFSPQNWTDTPAPPLLFYTEFYDALFQIAVQHGLQAHIRGDFGDQLFHASPRYLRHLFEEQQFLRLFQEVWRWKQSGTVTMTSVLLSTFGGRHAQERTQVLSTKMPWVRQDIIELGTKRQNEEKARLRSLIPDPLARRLYQSVLHHEDYVAQQDEVIAHGLETREPYMDGRLLSFLLSSPPYYQTRFGIRKFLLREVMQGVLPEPIRTRYSKGRIARVLFAGIAHHHQALRHLIVTMPAELEPFIDAARLAQALDVAACGGVQDQGPFLRALALVLWAHRLPWCEGKLPRIECPTYSNEKGGEKDHGTI